MNRIKENINYIISKDDSDKDKLMKILQKMQENNVEFKCLKYEISEILDGFVQAKAYFKLQEEDIILPFVVSVSNFNIEVDKIIMNMKKFIIFEILCIIHEEKQETVKQIQGSASQKQLSFINDKMKYNDSKQIIDDKLKELKKEVNNITKDEASAIITALGRR
ncbi:MAG: hypothetical protein RR795_01640 [Cetobacterium sp.]|uniref:hypothetical protein n=1 Tax=Cetobacterium sp. TaxID=2071632 RepID=UPI002FC7AA11